MGPQQRSHIADLPIFRPSRSEPRCCSLTGAFASIPQQVHPPGSPLGPGPVLTQLPDFPPRRAGHDVVTAVCSLGCASCAPHQCTLTLPSSLHHRQPGGCVLRCLSAGRLSQVSPAVCVCLTLPSLAPALALTLCPCPMGSVLFGHLWIRVD